jgi:hypothetical protein
MGELAHRTRGTGVTRYAFGVLLLVSALFAETGARYLIVTHDNFYPAIQPLAQWKTQKGMPAKTVKLSEIGSSPSQIQSYVRTAYSTWPIRPEYVLLVGSPNYVPGWTDRTDDGYGDMTGNYEVELPVGRLFANTVAECSTMVAKCLVYEKTPFSSGDSGWMRKGQTIVREDNPPDAYYQADCRYIRGLMNAAGYMRTESLMNTWGHNSTNVRNGIADGRGFVVHRGQCVSNWWPPFDQVQPGTLANGDRLPIVVSGSCQTLTLAAGQSMLADQFVRAGTAQARRGAAAYFGTTVVGSHISLQRSIVTKAFFTAVFLEGRYKLGDACKRGKFALDSVMPGNQSYYQEWVLLGDPELPVWTDKPSALAATFDSTIPLGNYNFGVHVTRSGAPLAGALICVTMDSTVYVTGTTNAGGDAVLPLNTSHLGSLLVTITGRNCLPFEGTARATAGNVPYVVFQRYRIDDGPGGNGDGRVNPGEAIRLALTLKNVGDSQADGVTAGLASDDSFAVVVESLETYGDIAPQETANSIAAYRFTVAPSCTSGQGLGFGLHIRDAHGRAWLSTFPVPVYAANIRYTSVQVNDPPPGGNGDGALSPHESARLVVNLQNAGSDLLRNVSAILRTSSSYVSITDSTGFFGDIAPQYCATNGDDPFAVTTSPNLPPEPVWFTLLIQGDGGTYGYRHVRQFSLLPAGTSGPIGPDPYGYYCYDDTDTLSGRAPVFSWLELAPPGPGQLIPGVTDNDAGLDTVALPFQFRYYGTNYGDITVASNGFAALGRTGYRGSNNTRIPSESAPGRNLIPMWDDMNPDQNHGGYGDIYQYYDAASHRWIEEFYQVAHYWSQTTRETFQMILLDPAYYPTPTGDGEALFLYQIVGDPNYATVGIQDNSMTRGIEYEYNGAYDPNAAQIVNSRALRFTTLAPSPSVREWLTLSWLAVDDSAGGNNNHIPEPGETIRLTLGLSNLGSTTASSVTGTLENDDGNAIVTDSLAGFGDIPAQSQGSNASDPYLLQIVAQPLDSLAQFILLARSQNSSNVLYFTLPLGSVTGLAGGNAVPPVRADLAAFPNPAPGRMMLKFALPEPGPVDLSIYDASGRRVKTLFEGQVAAGSHEVRWRGDDANGRKVAAGVYFGRLIAGNGTQLVRKLQIAR